jgi:hypothetical protein
MVLSLFSMLGAGHVFLPLGEPEHQPTPKVSGQQAGGDTGKLADLSKYMIGPPVQIRY